MSYIKSSEIGSRNMVMYRAQKLGIEPLSYSNRYRQFLYSVEDADRILAYRSNYNRDHSIAYYRVLEEILKRDDLTRYNVEYCAGKYKTTVAKMKSILDEYHLTGCFITPSKMNNKSLDL